MQPQPEITEEEAKTLWGSDATVKVYACPPGMVDCEPIATVQTVDQGTAVVHVPWVPDAQDLAVLQEGGVVWLKSWGGLSPHALQVLPAQDRPDEPKEPSPEAQHLLRVYGTTLDLVGGGMYRWQSIENELKAAIESGDIEAMRTAAEKMAAFPRVA